MRAMPAGLDLGSSSVKAVTAPPARPGTAARRRIATRRRAGGRVEQDAEAILGAALLALRAALPRRSREVEALGLATQRSTVLFWDRDTGRPLTPAYSWQDLRGAPLVSRLRKEARADGDLDDAIGRRTGLRLSPHYSASKLSWALHHVRGLRRRVAAGKALWGTLGTFLVWRLTGGAVYAIDHANAQRTLLFDLVSRSWDPELFDMFGLGALIDAPALPAALPTTLTAPVSLDRSGLPLRLLAMTGDQQAALIGLGCRAEGAITINYGSGAFVLISTGERLVRVPGLLTTLLASWRGGAGPRPTVFYALEGPVNAAATAIDWALKRLRLRIRTADLDRYLDGDRDPRRPVHFLPAVAGVGAPRWDPAQGPRFAGDLRRAGPRDLLRAVVESIAFRCAEIVRAAPHGSAGRPGAARGASILAAGGLTRCRTLLQAQADLLQRPIVVRDTPDATSLGAALLTRNPSGWWGRNDAGQDGFIVRPRISRDEAVTRYAAWEKAVYGEAASR
ncbi:MAG: hypothetical protein AUH92_01535 [Acidobacteria bacterium 13_1_40CM_4_69_4]|nr:MAG: hypothetical protein AUH92_01535 [Acidobacteria bacterium 13_1_40CM_4_69_4]